MWSASRLVLVALLVFPVSGEAQEETRRPVAKGNLIRVTYVADTGQAKIRGKYEGQHARQLILTPDQGDRQPIGLDSDLIKKVEVGKRGHGGGVVGALLGGALGLVAANAATSSDSPSGCYVTCGAVDDGAVIGAIILPVLGIGMGYLLGHQMDGVQWVPAAYPPPARGRE